MVLYCIFICFVKYNSSLYIVDLLVSTKRAALIAVYVLQGIFTLLCSVPAWVKTLDDFGTCRHNILSSKGIYPR
jgi:hypothetical protein